MARGIDPQFTRLYQIDPSAYEGPSAWEGLADLVSAINQSTAQQEEKKRYADKLAYQAERDAKADSDVQAERDWRKKVYDDGEAEKLLAKERAADALAYKKQKDAWDEISKNTAPGSEERLLSMKTGEFDLLEFAPNAIAAIQKNVTERKRIRDVFGGLGVAEDATIPEIKDVMTIERGNLTEAENKQLMDLMRQRYALEDNIKTSPEYVAAEAKLKTQDAYSDTVHELGVPKRILNSAGIEKLNKVKQELAGKMGLAPTEYIGGLAPGALGPIQWGEPKRKGTYLYEGLQVSEVSPSYPVDDKGELTEEAQVTAENINQAIQDGDSIAAVLDPSLNASQVAETMVTPSPGRPSPDLAMIPQEQKEKDYLVSYELTDRQTLSATGEDVKTKGNISKAFKDLPIKKDMKGLDISPSTIPSEDDLYAIAGIVLDKFSPERIPKYLGLPKDPYGRKSRASKKKLNDTKNYFLALERASKDRIDRDPYGGKEARKKQAESVFAKYIEMIDVGKPIPRIPYSVPARRPISPSQRILDTTFPG